MHGIATALRTAMRIHLERRRFLQSTAGLATAALVASRGSWAQDANAFPPAAQAQRLQLLAGYRQTVQRMLDKTPLPIIDVELHWGDKLPIENLIDNMDRSGVALTWLGPNEKNGSASSLERCQAFPTRLVPAIIHGDGPRWHGQDLSLVQEIAADARSGSYFAMGEFESRHYVSGSNDRDVHMPADSASFQGVFRAAQDTGLPFLLHHDAEDAVLPELETMLAQYPKAHVVWCHVGRNRNPKTWTRFPTPEGVAAYIQRYPNLHFDILQGSAGSIFPPTGAAEAVLYYGRKSEVLRPEWVQLFNTYPERFVIGSDINTFRWNKYGDVLDRLRRAVLGALRKDAAETIAYKNAWRLMSGQAWG